MSAREAIEEVLRTAERVSKPPADGVVIERGSDLRIVPVAWLWRDWLARGKLHLLAGAPGQGKTTIALAFAATVTSGGRWPNGASCKPGNVLIYSGEDDPSDTLAPRLLASGADMSRCYFVKGTRIDGEEQAFDPARDMEKLRKCIASMPGGIDLLIVDPIVGAVTGDSHKNTETRRGLQPLVDLAAECRCALIGITHFQKGGQGTDPSMRVIGSVAFTALARVVMVAAKVQSEDDKPLRVLARAKSNIGPDDGGFEYHLEQTEIQTDVFASHVAWGNAVEGSARELLTDPDDDAGNDANDAATILQAELVSDCWTPADAAKKAVTRQGFTAKQVWSASKKLGVIRKKGGMTAGWYWRLPGGVDPELPAEDSQKPPEDSEDSVLRNVESLESSESSEPPRRPRKRRKPTEVIDIEFIEVTPTGPH